MEVKITNPDGEERTLVVGNYEVLLYNDEGMFLKSLFRSEIRGLVEMSKYKERPEWKEFWEKVLEHFDNHHKV